MTYKAYNLLVLILVRVCGVALIAFGLETRKLALGQTIWWSEVVLGIVVLAVSLVTVGLTATRTTEIHCPHCGKKLMAKVGLGLGAGHLHLSAKKKT